MPYLVKKINDKYRLVERDTGKIAKNQAGTPIDGGGKKTKSPLTKQMQALNISYARDKGIDIPKKKRKGATYK